MKIIVYIFIISIFISTFSNAQDKISLYGLTQGTTYTVGYYDIKNRYLKSEIDTILFHFNATFSSYNSTSTVSTINNNFDVKTDSLFNICFNKSMQISKETDGAFDITVAPLVNAWGFGKEQKTQVNQNTIDSLLQFVGFRNIFLYNNTIIKKDNRIKLDFNAIAQGYTVDIVSDFFLKMSIDNYVIEIGGEVLAHGSKPNGDKWIVGIEKPIENKTSEVNELKLLLSVKNKAVSTSGNYRKFYIENGVKYSHTINPKTGYPAKNNILSATLVANDCASADAYATACMVMGLEKSIEFLKKHSELEAYLIYSLPNGEISTYSTIGFQKLILEEKK